MNAVHELDANRAFATASLTSVFSGLSIGTDAIFYTDNYGINAGWIRVLRTSRTDLVFGPGLGNLATSGRAFAYFNNTGVSSDKVLVTSDGGFTWEDAPDPNPFDFSPAPNEAISAESIRSSSLLYYGGDKGHVSVSTNGGNSWTILPRDFGDDIDEFDFTSYPSAFNPAVLFVGAEDSDNKNKVWITGDYGLTFSQVGDAPWGTGDGTIDLHIGGYDPATGTGHLIVVTGGATAVDDVWRLQMPTGNWTPLNLGVAWTSSDMIPAAGAGDGQVLMLWQNSTDGGPKFFYTFNAFTGNPALMKPISGADPGRNLLLELPPPPVPSAITLSTAFTLPGLTRQFVASNRIMELTLTGAFATKPAPTIPANGAVVPSNLGVNGIPAVLRWGAVEGADTYQVRIGLQPDLSDAIALGRGVVNDPLITSPQAILDAQRYALISGSVYYWQVQVQSAGGMPVEEGPWSDTKLFGVVPAAAGGVGGKNLTIRAGVTSATSIDLSWDQGGAQAGYQVRRFDIVAGTDAIIGGTLPQGATSLSDPTAVSGSLYCYVVLPVDAANAILGISDLECAMAGLQGGAPVPGHFGLRLNQSTVTTLSWDAPVGGADGYIPVVIPLDGSPVVNVSLDSTVRAVSRAEPGGRSTCYVLAAVQGVSFGSTNLLCGLPGFATLAAPSTGVAPGASPTAAPGRAGARPTTYTLRQLKERFQAATVDLRRGASAMQERAKQTVEKARPKGPGAVRN